MTDRFVSWTDAEHVAALIARVAPARGGQEARARVYGSTSQVAPRTVASATVAASSPLPNSAARLAREVRAVGEGVQHPRAPRLIHTSESVVERIDALVGWTLANHRCAGVFVADDNGLTLAAHGVSEAIVSVVGPLLSALASIRTIPGVEASAGALWLGAQMMSWVETRTERGGFCLGVLGDEALPAAALSGLREALDTTVRGI